MEREQLIEKLKGFDEGLGFEENQQFLIVSVEAKNFLPLAEFLRNDNELNFNYMFCQTGIDLNTEFIVAYHLRSTEKGHELVLKAKITERENAEIETVSHLWKTAEFHEREIFEMFGINFKNHPDLRKLLLPDDWEGFPLRKDYHDPVHITEL